MSHCVGLCRPTMGTPSVETYLNLGLSTNFLNCFTLLKVCSASSLEGSMIRALGAFDEAFA